MGKERVPAAAGEARATVAESGTEKSNDRGNGGATEDEGWEAEAGCSHIQQHHRWPGQAGGVQEGLQTLQ